MKRYQHILFATDGTAENEAVGEEVKDLSRVFDARISLLRVLDHLPFDEPVDLGPPENEDQLEWLKRQALESLCEFAQRFDIPVTAVNVDVTYTSPEQEIIRFAGEHDVDLIIVGAHERHGLSLLRGATTDTVVLTEFDGCPADLDDDGVVGFDDLLILLAAWGTPDGDTDGDDQTDFADLVTLLAAWGPCP